MCIAPLLLFRFYPDADYGVLALAGVLSWCVVELVHDWRAGMAAIVALFMLGTYSVVSDRTLTGRNTVYEFMKADGATQSAFKANMCRNGGCIPYADWKCGFSNGLDSAVRECFDTVTKRVEPWEKLDRIAKFCGQTFAEFVDTQFSTAAACEKVSGVWGVKSTLPRLQQRP